MNRCLLILAGTTSYRLEAFLDAAGRLPIDTVVATNGCPTLSSKWPSSGPVVDFDDVDAAISQLTADAVQYHAVVAVDDQATVLAAHLNERLGVAYHSPAAATRALDKLAMREACEAWGVSQPRFVAHALGDDRRVAARRTAIDPGFPCVLKPVDLSASRGVIRADDMDSFVRAWTRIAELLQSPDLARRPDASNRILVESFVPGRELALEGLMRGGELTVLALFDKPDPLDGPYFEETIYVTPARVTDAEGAVITEVTALATQAMGLDDGPIHAEVRLDRGRPTLLEVAGRSIGGMCSRALRFGLGEVALEEVILRHLLELELPALGLADRASGVMMLPIPRAGALREVRGVDAARAVPGVTDVAISIRRGERLVPLPEGSSYLGFVFARADKPDAVEVALRAAHAALEIDISPAVGASVVANG